MLAGLFFPDGLVHLGIHFSDPFLKGWDGEGAGVISRLSLALFSRVRETALRTTRALATFYPLNAISQVFVPFHVP